MFCGTQDHFTEKTHVVRIMFCGTQDHFTELSVLFHERWHERIKESENVVTDKHLTVAMRPGANADRRNLQPGSDCLGNSIRNRLEHYRECSGVFECERIEDQFQIGRASCRE